MDNRGNEIDLEEARRQIGHRWGLARAVTKSELARALQLSDAHGGDYISRLEKGAANLGGATLVAIQAFVDGWRPRNMDQVIKPGYPRGPVR